MQSGKKERKARERKRILIDIGVVHISNIRPSLQIAFGMYVLSFKFIESIMF
jgi:hypothetical protein